MFFMLRCISNFRRSFSFSCPVLIRQTNLQRQNCFIYDTRSRLKLPLKSEIPGIIKWYMCGPTVYADSHIGHALTYVRFDIIRRILSRLTNHHVLLAMCITDIDDKIIAASKKQGVAHTRIARKFERDFFLDMDKLGVTRPSLTLRVTEHIPQIIAFIQRAVDKNFAYITSDGSVYFDVMSYGKQYGIFVDPQFSAQDAVGNVDKRSPVDFALWKVSKSEEPSWPVTWSNGVRARGRPGWHIECSTLSTLAFGNRLDIHSGGEDLIFPHHQNEVCQCVGAGVVSNPADWVGHWMHAGHLHMPASGTEEKMSKSLGNTISISDFLNGSSMFSDVGSISSAEFRVFTSLTHYRERVALTSLRLNEAKNMWRRIDQFVSTLRAWAFDQLQLSPSFSFSESDMLCRLKPFRYNVACRLLDDFDTPGAMKELETFMKETNRLIAVSQHVSTDSQFSRVVPLSYLETINWFSSILGLPDPLAQDNAKEVLSSNNDFVHALTAAVEFRSVVRQLALSENSHSKNNTSKALLNQCDKFRDNLSDLGFAVKDTALGKTTWSQR